MFGPPPGTRVFLACGATDMRTGAYVLAVSRVAEATRMRGIFP